MVSLSQWYKHDGAFHTLGNRCLYFSEPSISPGSTKKGVPDLIPRFKKGTKLLAISKEEGFVYSFVAGKETKDTLGIYDSDNMGLFPYSTYDFYIISEDAFEGSYRALIKQE